MQIESVQNQSVINRMTLLELNVSRHLVLLHCKSLDFPGVLKNIRQRVFVSLPVQITNVDAVVFIFSLAGLKKNAK